MNDREAQFTPEVPAAAPPPEARGADRPAGDQLDEQRIARLLEMHGDPVEALKQLVEQREALEAEQRHLSKDHGEDSPEMRSLVAWIEDLSNLQRVLLTRMPSQVGLTFRASAKAKAGNPHPENPGERIETETKGPGRLEKFRLRAGRLLKKTGRKTGAFPTGAPRKLTKKEQQTAAHFLDDLPAEDIRRMLDNLKLAETQDPRAIDFSLGSQYQPDLLEAAYLILAKERGQKIGRVRLPRPEAPDDSKKTAPAPETREEPMTEEEPAPAPTEETGEQIAQRYWESQAPGKREEWMDILRQGAVTGGLMVRAEAGNPEHEDRLIALAQLAAEMGFVLGDPTYDESEGMMRVPFHGTEKSGQPTPEPKRPGEEAPAASAPEGAGAGAPPEPPDTGKGAPPSPSGDDGPERTRLHTEFATQLSKYAEEQAAKAKAETPASPEAGYRIEGLVDAAEIEAFLASDRFTKAPDANARRNELAHWLMERRMDKGFKVDPIDAQHGIFSDNSAREYATWDIGQADTILRSAGKKVSGASAAGETVVDPATGRTFTTEELEAQIRQKLDQAMIKESTRRVTPERFREMLGEQRLTDLAKEVLGLDTRSQLVRSRDRDKLKRDLKLAEDDLREFEQAAGAYLDARIEERQFQGSTKKKFLHNLKRGGIGAVVSGAGYVFLNPLFGLGIGLGFHRLVAHSDRKKREAMRSQILKEEPLEDIKQRILEGFTALQQARIRRDADVLQNYERHSAPLSERELREFNTAVAKKAEDKVARVKALYLELGVEGAEATRFADAAGRMYQADQRNRLEEQITRNHVAAKGGSLEKFDRWLEHGFSARTPGGKIGRAAFLGAMAAGIPITRAVTGAMAGSEAARGVVQVIQESRKEKRTHEAYRTGERQTPDLLVTRLEGQIDRLKRTPESVPLSELAQQIAEARFRQPEFRSTPYAGRLDRALDRLSQLAALDASTRLMDLDREVRLQLQARHRDQAKAEGSARRVKAVAGLVGGVLGGFIGYQSWQRYSATHPGTPWERLTDSGKWRSHHAGWTDDLLNSRVVQHFEDSGWIDRPDSPGGTGPEAPALANEPPALSAPEARGPQAGHLPAEYRGHGQLSGHLPPETRGNEPIFGKLPSEVRGHGIPIADAPISGHIPAQPDSNLPAIEPSSNADEFTPEAEDWEAPLTPEGETSPDSPDTATDADSDDLPPPEETSQRTAPIHRGVGRHEGPAGMQAPAEGHHGPPTGRPNLHDRLVGSYAAVPPAPEAGATGFAEGVHTIDSEALTDRQLLKEYGSLNPTGVERALHEQQAAFAKAVESAGAASENPGQAKVDFQRAFEQTRELAAVHRAHDAIHAQTPVDGHPLTTSEGFTDTERRVIDHKLSDMQEDYRTAAAQAPDSAATRTAWADAWRWSIFAKYAHGLKSGPFTEAGRYVEML